MHIRRSTTVLQYKRVSCKGLGYTISRYKQTQISNQYRTDRAVQGRVGMARISVHHAQGRVEQKCSNSDFAELSPKSRF